MARARNLKPSLFKNELLGVADPLLTILFEGLWCLADKAGRLEDRPLRIKAEILPYREGIDVNGFLTELERLGFIRRYSAGDQKLIQVLNFAKHQNPHHTEKASEYPEFSTTCQATVNDPLNNGDTPADSLLPPTDSLNTDSEHTHEGPDVFPSVEWEYPMKQLVDAFPNLIITPAMIGFIEADVLVGDEAAWKETLELYKRNYDPMTKSYLPEKTGNLLETFQSKKAQAEKRNGISKNNGGSNQGNAGTTSADFYQRIGANPST